MSPTLRDDSDLSACLATLKNVTSTNIDIDTSTFVSVVWFLAIWSLVSHSLNIIYRVRHLLDLRFLSQHGYGRRWNYKHAMDLDCLLAPDSANRFDEMKRDYRVTRDLRIYNFHLSALSFLVALICDFPWSAAMVFKINVSNMGLVEQLSLATAGVSFGSKVKNAWNLLHNWRQYIIAVTTAGKLLQLIPSDVICATGVSTLIGTRQAVDDVWAQISSKTVHGHRIPSLIVVGSSGRDPKALKSALSALVLPERTAVVGLSSCAGITVDGVFSGRAFAESTTTDAPVVSMFAVCDDDGIYEVEHATFDNAVDMSSDAIDASVRNMVRKIMKRHDGYISDARQARPPREDQIDARVFLRLHNEEGAVPAIVWVQTSQIPCELVLRTLQAEWGEKIRCVGGCAADEKIRDERTHLIYSQSTDVESALRNCDDQCASTSSVHLQVENMGNTRNFSTACAGISIAACWPSVQIRTAFESGFSESGHVGTITKVGDNRIVKEIDGEPAAIKYDNWTCGLLSELRDARSQELQHQIKGHGQSNKESADNIHEPLMVLAETSPWPLAVEQGVGANGDFRLRIIHPIFCNSDDSIAVASGVHVGDKVHLVYGSRNRLVQNLPLLAERIVERIEDSHALLPIEKQVCGTISIYCGGCLLHVQDRIHEMSSRLSEELGSQPMICFFTFGEVGAWSGGQSYLGNLMSSILIFTSSKLVARVVDIESGRILVEGYKNYNQAARENNAMRQLLKRNEMERMGQGVRQLTFSRKRSSLIISRK
jgi:hypothetical protein